MRCFAIVAMLAALPAPAAAQMAPPAPAAPARQRIAVTTEGTDIVIRLGPVRLPANAGHDGVEQLALQTWRMPAGGWIRGYRVEMVDARGNPVPQSTLHHAEMADLERRDLIRPAYNRVISAGKETSALALPPGMGYPVKTGQRLGINAMLHNPTATTIPAAYVRVRLTMVPDTATGIRNVLGFYLETSSDSSNGDSSYDLPAGRSERVDHFTVPIAGTVLAAGGHIHDFGTRLVATRMGAGDTLYSAAPRTDSAGTVLGMPMVIGSGMQLRPGDMLMLTTTYDNPTGQLLGGAGMGTLGVVFIPDDITQWPALDENDPAVRRDLVVLQTPVNRVMRQGRQVQHQHRH